MKRVGAEQADQEDERKVVDEKEVNNENRIPWNENKGACPLFNGRQVGRVEKRPNCE